MNTDKTIERIMWGKSIVDIQTKSISQTLILRSLNIREANEVSYIYDKEYERALSDGLMTIDELKSIYKSSGSWTELDDKKIKDCNEVIKRCNKAIVDAQFHNIKKRKLKKQLSVIEKQKNDLISARESLFSLSIERRAEEVSRRFAIFMSTEDLDEVRYWHSKKLFLKERNTELIFKLAIEYYKNNVFNTEELRKVARSPEWQFRFRQSKHGADLFGKPICDWTEMQNSLVYWGQVYDSVLNSHERPSDATIENDNALDTWMSDQSKKSNAQSTNGNKNLYGTKKATTTREHDKQFVIVAHNDKKAIKTIQEMNDSVTREKLRKNQGKGI